MYTHSFSASHTPAFIACNIKSEEIRGGEGKGEEGGGERRGERRKKTRNQATACEQYLSVFIHWSKLCSSLQQQDHQAKRQTNM